MDYPELNLGQLKTFVAVAERMSFIGAADAVHRSQAAVSMQIAKLESVFGQALFERQTRRIALTAAGERLLPYAQKLLQLERETKAVLRMQEVSGKVVLGAPDDYLSTLLPPILERFSRQFANVEIELVCLQSAVLQKMHRKGEIDLAFISSDASEDGIFIRREPLVWVGAPHRGAWNRSPLPVALFEKGCVARAHTVAALEQMGKPYRATHRSASLMGILAMIESGIAVAALAECSIPPHLARLGEAEGLPPVAPIDVVLLKGRNNSSPVAEYLATEIVDALCPHPNPPDGRSGQRAV